MARRPRRHRRPRRPRVEHDDTGRGAGRPSGALRRRAAVTRRRRRRGRHRRRPLPHLPPDGRRGAGADLAARRRVGARWLGHPRRDLSTPRHQEWSSCRRPGSTGWRQSTRSLLVCRIRSMSSPPSTPIRSATVWPTRLRWAGTRQAATSQRSPPSRSAAPQRGWPSPIRSPTAGSAGRHSVRTPRRAT